MEINTAGTIVPGFDHIKDTIHLGRWLWLGHSDWRD